MKLSEVLKTFLSDHKMSYREFASRSGVTPGYLSMLVNERNPKTGKPPVPAITTYNAIAEAMGLTLDELFRMIDDSPVSLGSPEPFEHIPMPRNVTPITQLHRQRIPLIGKVAAGEPIYAPEDYDAYVDSPVKCDAAMEVKGDSMVPKFEDGDTVYVRCQPDVGDGQVAVVFLDDEAVIKRVYHEKEGLTLLSDNPAYGPIRATFDEYNVIRIFGIPVGLTRMFKPDLSNKIRKGFK